MLVRPEFAGMPGFEPRKKVLDPAAREQLGGDL